LLFQPASYVLGFPPLHPYGCDLHERIVTATILQQCCACPYNTEQFSKSSVQQKQPAKLPETKTVVIVSQGKTTAQTQKLLSRNTTQTATPTPRTINPKKKPT